MDHRQLSFDEPRPAGSHVYTFDGQMLIIAAIAFVFLFVVLLTSLHFYARWWLRNGQAFVVSGDHHTAAAALPGLDPAVLRSLPVFTCSSSEPGPTTWTRPECAVCLSEFEEGETGRLLPKCKHSFHVDCIDMWFHSHSTCPLCRAPVEPGPVVVVVEINGPETGSSSGLCDTCQHEEEGCEESMTSSLARRRKAATVKIDVEKPKIESESTTLQGGSPVMMTSRMSSFKRLLSMGGMSSPSGSRMGTPRYRAAAELDLESGLGEPSRVYTPK